MVTEQHPSRVRRPRHTLLGIGRGLPAEGETGNHFPQPVILLVEAEKLPVILSSGGVCSLVSKAMKLIQRCHRQLSLHTLQFSFPSVVSKYLQVSPKYIAA